MEADGFHVVGLSVREGAVWQINREIVISFNEPVDFSTVSANTIHIRSAENVPAIGVLRLRDPSTVVFQPNCPTREDHADAGLAPGGVTYVLRIPGKDTSANTVRSASGLPLVAQQSRTFTTPASNQASILFQDSRIGPPRPILRARDSGAPNATHLEIGADSDQRVYFERDEQGAPVLSEPGFRSPLNLYSDPASHIAFLIAFDQSVSPSASNLSPDRIRVEYLDSRLVWHALDTRVTLLANCTESGALVRLDPIGVLPPSSTVRASIRPGFQDLVGETLQESLTTFADVPTRTVELTSLLPADRLADELDESFDFGAESPLTFMDDSGLIDSPMADWGGGRLSAAFSFEGTGGPRGDFDWILHSGELFFFDTTFTQIIGGPGGVPTGVLTAVDGILDLRNLTIERGAEIRVQGPNPLRIRATGEVRIDGRLNLSGLNARDVLSLNTGNLVERGGAGAAGGGKGGNANDNTMGYTLRGGRGDGPLQHSALGGEGSELGTGRGDDRRPGGGGGGRFARDWIGTTTAENLSLAAHAGSDGPPNGAGADPFDGHKPARGGQPGAGPFLDGNDENDFFGVRPVVTDGKLIGLARGELASLWGGYGGGGGGNASTRYPQPNWDITSDEKGGGGGGGAGGLHIQALGRIVFGPEGLILANGAKGGLGETAFFEPRGGIGGGGSGGHVILETAALVDFTGDGVGLDGPPHEAIQAYGPLQRTDNEFGNGGAGGGGVIQIHVPDPVTRPGTSAPADILVPAAALQAADVLDQVTSPPAVVLVPSYGKRSKVRSKWISIGGADQEADGSVGLVRFLFDGVDPEDGKILTTGATVTARAPLVTEDHLETSTVVRILPDGFTLELTGGALDALRSGSTAGISNDLYLRTPSLLEDCAARLRVAESDPPFFEDFSVAAASYDEGSPDPGDELLRLTVGAERGPLTAFNPANELGTTGFQLVPRFFQVTTDGLAGSLPATAFVKVRFQAAAENAVGAPDGANPLVDWTSDITDFNALRAGELRFFRFEVEFDLDSEDNGLTADTKPVTLDFLKIPFVF